MKFFLNVNLSILSVMLSIVYCFVVVNLKEFINNDLVNILEALGDSLPFTTLMLIDVYTSSLFSIIMILFLLVIILFCIFYFKNKKYNINDMLIINGVIITSILLLLSVLFLSFYLFVFFPLLQYSNTPIAL